MGKLPTSSTTFVTALESYFLFRLCFFFFCFFFVCLFVCFVCLFVCLEGRKKERGGGEEREGCWVFFHVVWHGKVFELF